MRLNPCSNGILKYHNGDLRSSIEFRLNPCSNGILKYQMVIQFAIVLHSSLNPCSNGILKYYGYLVTNEGTDKS